MGESNLKTGSLYLADLREGKAQRWQTTVEMPLELAIDGFCPINADYKIFYPSRIDRL